MRPGKVVLLVLGGLSAFVGLVVAGGGGTVVWVHATQRDGTGYYTTPTHRFETPTYALTSEHLDLGADVRGEWALLDDIGTARIRARSASEGPVFVGIARTDDVDRFLAASAHDELIDVEVDPFRAEYRRRAGEVPPAPPTDQGIWVASASGPGRQTVTWDVEGGEWAVVVMNADTRPGVSADVSVGIRTGLLLPIGLGLVFGGLVALAVGATLMVAALRGRTPASPARAPAPGPAAAAATTGPAGERSYPLRLDARLDEPLGRRRWLVKWLLAIPHFVVLALLWVVSFVLTVVAGFAILFTGRYPRAIFDFNLGVMRWCWRVSFYALTLGTDRYPPFSLEPDPGYPAELDVEYPESLSRGLVLVKWWLLAIPHYLVVGIFGGGFTWWLWDWAGDSGRLAGGMGLIGLLALVAGVTLAATSRYPRPVFDFVVGMQRWSYRVWAYAGLMTDEYPPFRLDSGGPDPGTQPEVPPPPVPSRDDRVAVGGRTFPR